MYCLQRNLIIDLRHSSRFVTGRHLARPICARHYYCLACLLDLCNVRNEVSNAYIIS